METVQFRDVAYRRVPMEDCLALGRGLNDAGGRWHSHVLSPGCVHNPFPERYAIVIEDDEAGIPYIAEGTDEFPEVDKAFVKMLHGDDILDESAVAASDAGADSSVVSHVGELQRCGHPWHHHMHFPRCVLNLQPGEWAISIESPSGVFCEGFDDEPVDALRRVEVVYFANLANAESKRAEDAGTTTPARAEP